MAHERRSIAERIIHKVADSTGSDALDLPLLYDAVDPDALEALVEQMSEGRISFDYAGYEVTVASDGTVSLDDGPDGPSRDRFELGECGV